MLKTKNLISPRNASSLSLVSKMKISLRLFGGRGSDQSEISLSGTSHRGQRCWEWWGRGRPVNDVRRGNQSDAGNGPTNRRNVHGLANHDERWSWAGKVKHSISVDKWSIKCQTKCARRLWTKSQGNSYVMLNTMKLNYDWKNNN